MAIASAYGIPKSKLPVFSSGKKSDLMKGLDSLLGPHRHLSEDYKYHILLDPLQLPTVIKEMHLQHHTLHLCYGQPSQQIQAI